MYTDALWSDTMETVLGIEWARDLLSCRLYGLHEGGASYCVRMRVEVASGCIL